MLKILHQGSRRVCVTALSMSLVACGFNQKQNKTMHHKSASEILGNPNIPQFHTGDIVV